MYRIKGQNSLGRIIAHLHSKGYKTQCGQIIYRGHIVGEYGLATHALAYYYLYA